MEKEINIEQSYYIGLIFLNEIWPLVKPKFSDLSVDKETYELFFYSVCSGEEASSEWKEAVYKVFSVPPQQYENIVLTEADVFSLTIAFCEIYNRKWENKLEKVVQFLHNMKSNPEKNADAQTKWKNALHSVLTLQMKCGQFL